MIADLKQPAQLWLADVLKNFGTLMEKGDDPSMFITINEVKLEIRLMELPGFFHRESVTVELNPELLG